jgi:hypothetical protein
MNKSRKRCPGCKASNGEYHRPGCAIETCPHCGHELHRCMARPGGCRRNHSRIWPPPLDDRIPWNGHIIGIRECLEFGWTVRPVHGQFVRCPPTHPKARLELARLYCEARWDRDRQRFVRTSKLDGRRPVQPPASFSREPIVVPPPPPKGRRTKEARPAP